SRLRRHAWGRWLGEGGCRAPVHQEGVHLRFGDGTHRGAGPGMGTVARPGPRPVVPGLILALDMALGACTATGEAGGAGTPEAEEQDRITMGKPRHTPQPRLAWGPTETDVARAT